MSQPRTLLAVACVLLALAACERRPSDPPRPTTLLATHAMTVGFAGLPAPRPAKPPHGPASDPPPSPLPRPPSAPGSGASGVPG